MTLREVKAQAQTFLVLAIFFVSSFQFLVHDPTIQAHGPSIDSSFFNDGQSRNHSDPSLRGAPPRPVGSNLPDNALTNSNATKIRDVTNNAAAANIVFCGSCLHNPRNTCNERLDYMMRKHRLPEHEAKETLMSVCGINPLTEPYVLLHAGPHKTGTTSLQAFLYDSLWKNALEKDKVSIPTENDLPGVFHGDGTMLNFAHCMLKDYTKDGGQMNVAFCNRIRNAFPPFLEQAYSNSQNVYMVAEDLDRFTIYHSRIQYSLKPYRRFRVVVSYRRLHEWLPSWYNQIVDLYFSKYIQGESQYPSFVEWAGEQYDQFLQVHAIEVANRYRNSGKYESVDILNMHDTVPLMENLFCNYVPYANATCRAILEGAEPSKKNVGDTHEYERLATKAFLRKKIKIRLHRGNSLRIVTQLKKGVIDRGFFGPDGEAYPRVCLNHTFSEKILQTEMEQEKKYFPKWYELQGGDEGLRKEFNRKAQAKLCSMDDERILASGMLDPIFEEIR